MGQRAGRQLVLLRAQLLRRAALQEARARHGRLRPAVRRRRGQGQHRRVPVSPREEPDRRHDPAGELRELGRQALVENAGALVQSQSNSGSRSPLSRAPSPSRTPAEPLNPPSHPPCC